MRFDSDRVLVLSPHTDDGELGAGGTISRLINEGKDIFFVVFSGCENAIPEGMPPDTLKKECLDSLDVLGIPSERIIQLDYKVRTFTENRQGILEDLIKIKKQINPDLVIGPSSNDVHQDHGVVHLEALRAFKRDSSIWGYEQPWNNLTFTTDIFFRISENHLKRKVECLKKYKSQSHRSYMDEGFIRSLACSRGAQLDIPYAEAFELMRLIY